jgi:hypothetical protein
VDLCIHVSVRHYSNVLGYSNVTSLILINHIIKQITFSNIIIILFDEMTNTANSNQSRKSYIKYKEWAYPDL